jgi:effector-binding domain-containing protein
LAGLLVCSSPSGQTETTNAETQATEYSAPRIEIEETTRPDMVLMVMEGKAVTEEEVGQQLGQIFGRITACAEKCKMEGSGPPMAWYSGPDAPWTLTAGMPFTTKCENPEEGISVKEVQGGKVVVAHYFGPYGDMKLGYETLEAYIKNKKLEIAGLPYEVYIGDPETETDPFKVQSDIVFPIK